MSLYDKPGWADGYDVVVHNECFGMVGDRDFIEEIFRLKDRKGTDYVLPMTHEETVTWHGSAQDDSTLAVVTEKVTSPKS